MIGKRVILLMNEEIAQTIMSLKMRHINSVYAVDRMEVIIEIPIGVYE